MRQARGLIAQELSGIGASKVWEEEVPLRCWHEGEARLDLIEPQVKTHDCVQHLYTASTELEAPLVDIGSGDAQDLLRLGRGAVAIVDGHVISAGKCEPLQARVARAVENGIRGLIFRGGCENTPSIEIIGITEDCTIPCVGVSKDSAAELTRAAGTGRARVRLGTGGSSGPATCANLVADIGPDPLPEEIIILGAHLDSFWNAPGALDNLTGVVTVLEIARMLSPLRNSFRRTLRVIAYTAEEIGFLGSKSYVQSHKLELDRISFVVNMDMLWPATAEGTAVMFSPEMRDYVAGALGDAADVRSMFCMSSDYLPFMLDGIPACRPAGFDDSYPPWSHTSFDDLGHIDIEWIQANAEVYARLLNRLLTDPNPLPSRRLTPDEVRARLEEEGVVESLRLYELGV